MNPWSEHFVGPCQNFVLLKCVIIVGPEANSSDGTGLPLSFHIAVSLLNRATDIFFKDYNTCYKCLSFQSHMSLLNAQRVPKVKTVVSEVKYLCSPGLHV